MIFRCIISLILLGICVAKIKIVINTASNIPDTTISFSGVDYKLVSEKEIGLFNISDDNLKRGMRVELGRVPEDVFLKDPTPYDNLFEYYEWPEVKRKLRVINTKVIQIINEKVILKLCDHINNTTATVKSNVNIEENTENTIFSTWFEEGLPNDTTLYDVNVNFNSKFRYDYENMWRSGKLRSVNFPLGFKNNGYIKIQPGQTITSNLTAFKTIILIEVDYEAKLIGSMIANYAHEYGKYHFWAPSVASIMKAAGLKNELRTTELIEIRCYTDPKLKVFDKLTGKNVKIIEPFKLFRIKKKIKH